MKNKLRKILLVLVVFTFTATLFSCFTEESDEEVRIYVTDSTPTDSYYISGLYVVKSPAGTAGNWGSNILNGNTNGPNGWQQYTFEPGTYDYKVVYWGKYWSSDDASFLEQTDFSTTPENGQGLKFDLDGYTLYTTSFTFSN